MARERETLTAGLVTGALAADDPRDAYVHLLEAQRTAWRAERALLLRADDVGAGTVVHEVSSPGAGERPDPERLLAACHDDAPVALERPPGSSASVLALPIRIRADGRWCLALVRRAAWTATDRRQLVALRPALELAVEHAVFRERLAEASDQLKASEREHERFLSAISHELRNPLAPILMWTSTLRRLRGDDPEVQRAATAIAHAVTLERRLIEQLLDLSRLERGVLEVVRERLDIADVVRDAVEHHRAAAAEAELQFEHDIPTESISVRADRTRLDQIVSTLLENAIKFTPSGGRVRVALARRPPNAEVTVADSGPGIPAEVLSRVFAPFVSGPNARGGLGLGLALAHRLIALHRGEIAVANAPDGGARATVTLPLAG